MQTTVWRRGFRTLALLALLLAGWSPALAEEIPWQRDYARAREAASAQNRPLLLSVGSEDCPWCRELLGTTFPDPAVSRMLARVFVPLRVEAERDAQLVQALQIQIFPTVIFAAADGTILHTVEGYADPAKMNQHILYAQARLSVHEEQRRGPASAAMSSGAFSPRPSPWEWPQSSSGRAASGLGRRC